MLSRLPVIFVQLFSVGTLTGQAQSRRGGARPLKQRRRQRRRPVLNGFNDVPTGGNRETL